mgnify:CR=1 FL=1
MCIRDSRDRRGPEDEGPAEVGIRVEQVDRGGLQEGTGRRAVSYTHLRAHETVLDLVCRLLLEKKKHPIHINLTT